MNPSFPTSIKLSVLPSRTSLALLGVAVLAAFGCGSGSGSTGLFNTGGSGTSGTSGSGAATTTGPSGSTGSAATGGSASTSGSGGSSTTTTSGTGGSAVTTGTGGATAGCPNEDGAYTVTDEGQGCGDLNVKASECIKATPIGCQVLLVSMAGPQAQGTAVDGTVSIDASGDFTNGSLKLGTVARTGCTGTWKPGPPRQLVVNCGGMATTQSCTVTLTHTGDTCGF